MSNVILHPDCTPGWFASLGPWEHRVLACIYRKGRHHRDGTDHGSDMRWCQAGVRTRDSFGNVRRRRRDDGWEKVYVTPTDYGYRLDFLTPGRIALFDPDTGEWLNASGYTLYRCAYVGHHSTGSAERLVVRRNAGLDPFGHEEDN